ncbi:hypothetical protein [Ferruginibacter sp.]
MKILSIKNVGTVLLLVSISSCKIIGWTLYQKYTYYKDCSDKKKLKYYADNKTIIDSMLLLSSTKAVVDYAAVAREPNKYGYEQMWPNEIKSGFFDTAGTTKNELWVKYIQRYPLQETETRAMISGMLRLSAQLKPAFPGQFELNNTAFLNDLVIIPLKKIKIENDDSGKYYSYIIVFNKAKLDIDTIKKMLPLGYDLKQIGDNMLTNKREKRHW